MDLHRQHRDGSPILVNTSSAAWRDFDGKIEGIVGVFTDVTERRRQERAIQAERLRMAHEMHDGLAQILAYVNAETAGIKALVERDISTQAIEEIEKLSANVRALSADVRDTMLGLRAAAGHPEGFWCGLSEFVDKFGVRHGLNLEVTGFDPPSGDQVDVADYHGIVRIVQEALSNAYKHSDCNSVAVRCAFRNDRTAITVEDDGRGFDMDFVSTYGTERMGIEVMKQRAETMGAELTIVSAPAQGTRIELVLPAPIRP